MVATKSSKANGRSVTLKVAGCPFGVGQQKAYFYYLLIFSDVIVLHYFIHVGKPGTICMRKMQKGCILHRSRKLAAKARHIAFVHVVILRQKMPINTAATAFSRLFVSAYVPAKDAYYIALRFHGSCKRQAQLCSEISSYQLLPQVYPYAFKEE